VPELESPWFAGQAARLYLFRVNRRPMGADTLFPGEPPADVFDHFVRVLAPGHEVITGRRHQRTWRVGGLHPDPETRTVVGQVGWEPRGETVIVPRWSPEEMAWTASTEDPLGGDFVPFGWDAETRLLAVLRDRAATAPSTVSYVFERILDENERELIEPTTDWSVEPILDRETFLSWLGKLDVIRKVGFTAKLPNPEPRDAFADLVARMERRRATHHSETMRSENEEGLTHPEEDPDFRQAIAMGEQGFAELRGEGVRGESVSKFSQRSAVATQRVDEMPDSWDGAWALFKQLLKGSLRRFLEEDEAA
jgi:hypothetical protein